MTRVAMGVALGGWLVLVGRPLVGEPRQHPIAPPANDQEWVQLTNADWGYYQRRYGDAITMSVDTLLDEASLPKAQAIRTFGTFQIPMNTMMGRSGTTSSTTGTSGGSNGSAGPGGAQAQGSPSTLSFQICGEARGHRCFTFVPVQEIASTLEFEAEAFRGQRVMIVGALDNGAFLSWSFEAMPESARRAKDSRDSGLRALVAAAGGAEKRSVRVRGQFRGRNLFGDLPAESQKSASDWVLQDQGVAVWVTGKAPKGDGWSLDLGSRSESVRWVEVEGEVAARDGVVYLKAKNVSLVSGPVAAAPPADR